jgi:hypothetical protein
MSKRLICVLSVERDKINPAALNCGNQSHHHISRAEAVVLEKSGDVEWIKQPFNGKEKGIVRVLKTKRQYLWDVPMRGMSAKYGATLAGALTKKKEIWPQVMLSDIRQHASVR